MPTPDAQAWRGQDHTPPHWSPHVDHSSQTDPYLELEDFAHLQSAVTADRTVVSSLQELRDLVADAARAGRQIRVRGNGHSLNSASLPRPGECLIDTTGMRRITFPRPGLVTVSAGVTMWQLQLLLNSFGLTLPVVNDGEDGPTLGGYAAAGGFGEGSARYSLFCDNVRALRLVTATGGLLEVDDNHPLFPWMFGSMGQLAIVAEAEIRVLAAEIAHYPTGLTTTTPPPATTPSPVHDSLFWFTLFIPPSERESARCGLKELQSRHSAFRFLHQYEYFIRQPARVAPLIYPAYRDFLATGVWGACLLPSKSDIRAAVNGLEADFASFTQVRGYHRYIQSETASGAAAHQRYFKPAIYRQFLLLKRWLDPRHLLNHGSVFPSGLHEKRGLVG